MKGIKYYFSLLFTFLKKYKYLIFVSLLVGILSYFAIFIFFLNQNRQRKEIIGIVGRYHANELPTIITSKVSQGLVKLDENLVPIPDLAKSWETTDNGKTWIFTLPNNIVWQDNSKLSAKDINFNFEDVSVTVIDNENIEFSLENEFSPFPNVLKQPLFKEGLLGIGDWKVKDISFSGPFVSKLSLLNVISKEKIQYKFYPTQDNVKTAFKMGKINKIEEISSLNEFDNWENSINIYENINKNQVVTIFFNNQKGYLSDKDFRQALIYAIDKGQFNNRAMSPISPNSWAYNPRVKSYDYDSEKSLSTIKEIQTDGGIEINLVSTPLLLNTAETLKSNWEKVGIKTNILVTSIIPEDFDAYLTIYDIPTDPDQYTLWHSTQKNSNISGYSSPRIDKLLEDGRSTVDLEERKDIYYDFQRFLMEDVPAYFLFHPTYFSIERK